jgi:hypothetical protein
MITCFSEPLQKDIHPLTGYTDHVRQFLQRELGPSPIVFVQLRDRWECTSQLSSLEYKRLLAKFSCTLTLSSINEEIKA